MMRTAIGLWSRVAPDQAARWLVTRFFTPTPWRKEAPPPSGHRVALKGGGVLWQSTEEGPGALLLHGWSGHRTQMLPLAEALKAQGHAVHLLDPPGHGAATPGQAHPLIFARALQEARAVTGPLTLVVGHSMGGAAAAHVACTAPDLAAGVVTISTPNGMDTPVNGVARTVGFGARATRRFRARVEKAVGAAPGELAIAWRAPVGVPLLAVHDADDPQIPFAEAETLAASWPGARLVRTSGSGHNRILSDPLLLKEVSSFAAKLEGAGARL